VRFSTAFLILSAILRADISEAWKRMIRNSSPPILIASSVILIVFSMGCYTEKVCLPLRGDKTPNKEVKQ